MISTVDIAWAAGIIEGEGCFTRNSVGSPLVQVQMNDRDVIERLCNLFGTKMGGPYGPYGNEKATKPRYRFYTAGPRAIGIMFTLFTFMGQRRRDRIKEIVASWRCKGV